MTHLLPLLPALACAAMIFGTAALLWIARTPLGRIPWVARHAQRAGAKAQEGS
jgi:hypothetical protein